MSLWHSALFTPIMPPLVEPISFFLSLLFLFFTSSRSSRANPQTIRGTNTKSRRHERHPYIYIYRGRALLLPIFFLRDRDRSPPLSFLLAAPGVFRSFFISRRAEVFRAAAHLCSRPFSLFLSRSLLLSLHSSFCAQYSRDAARRVRSSLFLQGRIVAPGRRSFLLPLFLSLSLRPAANRGFSRISLWFDASRHLLRTLYSFFYQSGLSERSWTI